MKSYLAKIVAMRKGESEVGYRSSIYKTGDGIGEKIAVYECEKFVFDHHKMGFHVTRLRTIKPFVEMALD